jgi:hypothetical protein
LRWPGGSRAARPLAVANADFDARAALECEHRVEKCMGVGAVEGDACTILDFPSPNFPSLLFDASNQRRCCQSICSTFPITDTSFFPSMAARVLPPSFALHRNNLAGSTAQLICSTSPTTSGRVRSAGRGRAGAATVSSTKLRPRMWASSA